MGASALARIDGGAQLCGAALPGRIYVFRLPCAVGKQTDMAHCFFCSAEFATAAQRREAAGAAADGGSEVDEAEYEAESEESESDEEELPNHTAAFVLGSVTAGAHRSAASAMMWRRIDRAARGGASPRRSGEGGARGPLPPAAGALHDRVVNSSFLPN
jgi:hypothetical protein